MYLRGNLIRERENGGKVCYTREAVGLDQHGFPFQSEMPLLPTRQGLFQFGDRFFLVLVVRIAIFPAQDGYRRGVPRNGDWPCCSSCLSAHIESNIVRPGMPHVCCLPITGGRVGLRRFAIVVSSSEHGDLFACIFLIEASNSGLVTGPSHVRFACSSKLLSSCARSLSWVTVSTGSLVYSS